MWTPGCLMSRRYCWGAKHCQLYCALVKLNTIFLGGRELLSAQDPRWEVKQRRLYKQLYHLC